MLFPIIKVCVNKRRTRSKKAFSLIELSIVIIIIAILILGVIGSKHLVKKSRISSAQSLTSSSPIVGVRDNAMWLESSLDHFAFSDNPDASDGDSLSSWKDNSNYNPSKVSISAVGSGPTYANTINYIQAVQFSASDSNYLQIDNAAFLNETDYTIFVLEKRESDSDDNYFLGDSDITTNNETLILGYLADQTPIHSQGSTNNYTASVEDFSSYGESPRLFTFISDSTDGKKMYINGVLAQESSDTTQLSNITTLPIGKGYNGEIGEIAIFTRSLKKAEREAIENYIGKKWNNAIARDLVSGGSCTAGIVTSTGCDLSSSPCTTPTIVGVSTTPKSVGPGASTLGCDGDHIGTISYTCTDTVFATTDSCTPAASCESEVIAGIIDTGTIIHANSGSSTCNASGYDNTITLSYDCDNGSLNVTSTPNACSCSSQYTGSSCDTCITGFTGSSCTDFATGYVSDGSGGARLGNNCDAGDVITGATATTAAKNHLDTGTLTCDSSGYDSSTITYTCNDGTSTADTDCACDTGYEGATCNACSTGYSDTDSGSALVCQQDCIVPDSTDGFDDGTKVIYSSTSTTEDCNTTDYTGTITYTCSAPGATITISSNDCTPPPLTCTGGNIIDTIDTDSDTIDDRKYHLFSSGGTFSCSAGTLTTDLQMMVVGAGGNGGNGYRDTSTSTTKYAEGGGGGSGQVVYLTGQELEAGDSFSISVGANQNTVISGTLSILATKGGNGGAGNSGSGGAGGASPTGGYGGGRGGGGGGGGGYTSGGAAGGAGSPNGKSAPGGTSWGKRAGDGGGTGMYRTITGSNIRYGWYGLAGNRNDGVLYGEGGDGGSSSSTTGAQTAGKGKGGVVIFSYPYP